MNPEIQKIFDNFSEDFNATFMYMTGRQQREIAFLAPTLFVRWYYSALFSETVLSPSTIAENQPDSVVKDKGFYSVCMRLKNVRGNTLEFNFKKNFYSIESHPIYNDLDIFLRFMSPVMHLNDDFTLKESDIRSLQRRLSISDRYYVLYLFTLSEKLGLFRQMPSLFEKCIQPDYDAAFFGMTQAEKFNTIVDESCGICASALNAEFPYEIFKADAQKIKEFIINPIPIDDILIGLYDASDMDVRDLLERADLPDLSDTETSVLSSIFYMGILLDRSFIYVFGHYLRIIRPLYSYPMKFREILNGLFNSIAIDGERDPELFLPCTAFIHTPLGKILFNKKTKDSSGYPPIPIDKILLSLDKERSISSYKQSEDAFNAQYDVIYTIKACLGGDRNLWKNIEMDSSTPLSVAARHMMMLFMMPSDQEYSFRIKRTDNDLLDFKNIEMLSDPDSTLADILYDNNTVLILVIPNEPNIEFRLTNLHSGCSEILYPRILEQSKEITQKEHELYLYD